MSDALTVTGSLISSERVDVVVGDVTVAADVERLFDGLSGTVDVIHTAGVIHPSAMSPSSTQ